MTNKHKDIFILALVVLYAATGTIWLAFAAGSSEAKAKAKPSIKVSPLTNAVGVDSFFRRSTTIKNKWVRYEWKVGDEKVDEGDLFTQIGLKTKIEKDIFRKKMQKEGYKRFKVTCKQLESVKGEWSLGYCINEEIKPEETS